MRCADRRCVCEQFSENAFYYRFARARLRALRCVCSARCRITLRGVRTRAHDARSFYNDFVEADTLRHAVDELLHDERSEHGHEINAVQRFNVWPELLLGSLYRAGDALSSGAFAATMAPMTFYIVGVYAVFGIGVAALARLSSQLVATAVLASSSSSSSSSQRAAARYAGWAAGGATLLLAACNYHHMTRAQLHPPLRENFGVPVCDLTCQLSRSRCCCCCCCCCSCFFCSSLN